jgi:release factor glutamine methyltransferase
MKNSKEIFRELQQQITLKEDVDEIRSILYLVVEHELRLTREDIISEKKIDLTGSQQKKLNEIIKRINAEEPIQYIVGEAHFFGRKFNVTPAVLIPRPETELLIEEALREINFTQPGHIVDIGSGSGCIAVTLAKELPHKKVTGIDVSHEAIKIARGNALQLDAPVDFQQVDVLKDFPFNNLEMIVSNPPYISHAERNDMKANVLKYEPHLALFVNDHDPLLFYRAIAKNGFAALLRNGKVVVEINERFGKQVGDIFKESGFKNVQIIKDLQNKDRIVIAFK